MPAKQSASATWTCCARQKTQTRARHPRRHSPPPSAALPAMAVGSSKQIWHADLRDAMAMAVDHETTVAAAAAGARVSPREYPGVSRAQCQHGERVLPATIIRRRGSVTHFEKQQRNCTHVHTSSTYITQPTSNGITCSHLDATRRSHNVPHHFPIQEQAIGSLGVASAPPQPKCNHIARSQTSLTQHSIE